MGYGGRRNEIFGWRSGNTHQRMPGRLLSREARFTTVWRIMKKPKDYLLKALANGSAPAELLLGQSMSCPVGYMSAQDRCIRIILTVKIAGRRRGYNGLALCDLAEEILTVLLRKYAKGLELAEKMKCRNSF